MRVVGYIRVSTAGQAEEGLGLEVQERAIKKWAKQNGHRLVSIERDEGISGANGIDKRLGLHRALNLLSTAGGKRKPEAEGLVVYKLDRLARDLLIMETTLAKLWQMGARVFSVESGEVERDEVAGPWGVAIRQMVGVFSQLEKGMIRDRLQAGRQLKSRKGQHAQGQPPYGMRAPSTDAERRAGQLVPRADEQDVVTYLRWLRDTHKRSLRELVAILEAEGIRPRRGVAWYPDTIRRVLDPARRKHQSSDSSSK